MELSSHTDKPPKAQPWVCLWEKLKCMFYDFTDFTAEARNHSRPNGEGAVLECLFTDSSAANQFKHSCRGKSCLPPPVKTLSATGTLHLPGFTCWLLVSLHKLPSRSAIMPCAIWMMLKPANKDCWVMQHTAGHTKLFLFFFVSVINPNEE